MDKNLENITIQKLIELDENIENNETHKLEEMSEIVRKNNIIIKVFGREGYIPHFHIYTTDGKKACLQFKENAYFAHDKYLDTLDTNDLKLIMNLMKQESEDMPGKTNWEAAIIVWNMNNASSDKTKKLPLDLQMPSYKSPRYDEK